MKQLIFLELNEVNFECINYYIGLGRLNNWKLLIEKYGITHTTSELSYELLEPWIQWPTIRSGKEYSEHNIFHLGDDNLNNIKQHWEILEEEGISVAAISPINGINNTKNSTLWLPDPWVESKVSGSYASKLIYRAVKQAVNDNAKEKLELTSMLVLFSVMIKNLSFVSFKQYLNLLFISFFRKRKWSKALILDRLLSDIFLNYCKKHNPKFITLFLNGAAHIQHHYFFNSPYHAGEIKNPEWYLPAEIDPLYKIFEMYDAILGQIISRFKDSRIIICTGLRQLPTQEVIYYWRLKEHEKFFDKLGFKFSRIEPRMSRDFTVVCDSESQAIKFQNQVKGIIDQDGDLIFSIADRRGERVYITLTYEKLISKNFKLLVNERVYNNFLGDVAFVAIKNGFHDGIGYLVDTDAKSTNAIKISSIFNRVLNHFSIKL